MSTELIGIIDCFTISRLQVYEPKSYNGNPDELLTVLLGYLFDNLTSTLQVEIVDRNSAFYTVNQGSVENQLAQHVNSAFSIDSIAASTNSGSPGSSGGDSSTGASSSSHVRTDAIIGVCSALGGIALIVLGWLIWRNLKNKRELAHRRLSDNNIEGAAPPGHLYDRDSIGGQRRRSFYYERVVDLLMWPTCMEGTLCGEVKSVLLI